jgi:WD40 repeat protein
LWQVEAGALLATLAGHSDWISRVVFAPDGQTLASSSNDGTVRLWSTNDYDQRRIFENQAGPILDIVFTPDGATLAGASFDQGLQLWNVADGVRTGQSVLSDPLWSLAVSPDGNLLAAGSEGEIILWGRETAEPIGRFQIGDGSVLSLTFSPNGATLFTGARDGAVEGWRVEDMQYISGFDQTKGTDGP